MLTDIVDDVDGVGVAGWTEGTLESEFPAWVNEVLPDDPKGSQHRRTAAEETE